MTPYIKTKEHGQVFKKNNRYYVNDSVGRIIKLSKANLEKATIITDGVEIMTLETAKKHAMDIIQRGEAVDMMNLIDGIYEGFGKQMMIEKQGVRDD